MTFDSSNDQQMTKYLIDNVLNGFLDKALAGKVLSAKTIASMVSALKTVGPALSEVLTFDSSSLTGSDLTQTLGIELAKTILAKMLTPKLNLNNTAGVEDLITSLKASLPAEAYDSILNALTTVASNATNQVGAEDAYKIPIANDSANFNFKDALSNFVDTLQKNPTYRLQQLNTMFEINPSNTIANPGDEDLPLVKQYETIESSFETLLQTIADDPKQSIASNSELIKNMQAVAQNWNGIHAALANYYQHGVDPRTLGQKVSDFFSSFKSLFTTGSWTTSEEHIYDRMNKQLMRVRGAISKMTPNQPEPSSLNIDSSVTQLNKQIQSEEAQASDAEAKTLLSSVSQVIENLQSLAAISTLTDEQKLNLKRTIQNLSNSLTNSEGGATALIQASDEVSADENQFAANAQTLEPKNSNDSAAFKAAAAKAESVNEAEELASESSGQGIKDVLASDAQDIMGESAESSAAVAQEGDMTTADTNYDEATLTALREELMRALFLGESIAKKDTGSDAASLAQALATNANKAVSSLETLTKNAEQVGFASQKAFITAAEATENSADNLLKAEVTAASQSPDVSSTVEAETKTLQQNVNKLDSTTTGDDGNQVSNAGDTSHTNGFQSSINPPDIFDDDPDEPDE
jgi:uncharacterized protein YwgA